MTAMLLVLGLVALFVGLCIYRRSDFENAGIALGVIGGFVTFGCAIAVIVLGISVSQEKVIDEKILLYQEQNAQIETKVGN